MKRFTSLAAAIFTAAFLAVATSVSAQDSNIDQRTYLTFSGPVQMPGVTLPAGKYVFKLAPTALHNVMQVFDGEEKHIIGQWFFVPAERTTEEQDRANGKPVVMFREMPEGTTPAVHYFYYPTDLRGKEFIYPKEQAVKIAAATHEKVLATDTDVAKGGEAHVFQVEPNGTESQYDRNATASNTVSNPEPFLSQPSQAEPSTPPPTASLNSQSDLNNSPASGPPASASKAVGTSGQNETPAPAPRQQASRELPKTASPYPLYGLFGLLLLAAGLGLRLARNTY
jgi:membrane anchored protein